MTNLPVFMYLWLPDLGAWYGLALEGHTSGIDSVAVSPDGRFIVSGSDDKTAKVWDIVTKEFQRDLIT